MANKKKAPVQPKKPKFSPYWIYGGLILIFIAVQFFGSGIGEPSKTTPSQFFQFVKNGDVKKVVIAGNTRVAQVFLTKDAEKKTNSRKRPTQ
jgi:cell division protease FtsH